MPGAALEENYYAGHPVLSHHLEMRASRCGHPSFRKVNRRGSAASKQETREREERRKKKRERLHACMNPTNE